MVRTVIIEGVATVGLAIVFGFLLPNKPSNSWQFSPIQRDMAVWRIEVEAGDANDENVSAKQGFMMAVSDIKTYYLVSCLC